MKTQVIHDLQDVIAKIVELLGIANESMWQSNFISMLRLSDQIDNEDALLKFCEGVISNFRGMGSLNDLVLQQNGKVMIAENDKLEILKDKLYKEAERIILKIKN